VSYETVTAALHARFATVVPALNILDHEPTAVQVSPCLYSEIDSQDRVTRVTEVMVTYRTLHRLCIRWQHNAAAEAELRALVDAIPQAIDAAPKLGGVARNAQISAGDGGWIEIGGTEYRTFDFYSDVTVMEPYLGINRRT
jgi:hypothetical protein